MLASKLIKVCVHLPLVPEKPKLGGHVHGDEPGARPRRQRVSVESLNLLPYRAESDVATLEGTLESLLERAPDHQPFTSTFFRH